jgi:Ca2+-binding EF-hand superfamily protein
MGVAGSAWSTVIVQAGAAGTFLWSMRHHLVRVRPAWEHYRPLLVNGAHMAVRSIAMYSVWNASTVIAAHLDAPTLAANQVVTQLFMFLALMLGAALVYFKQRAIEKSLQLAAQQRPVIAPDLERRMTQRFEAADADKSGAISREELARRLPAYAGRFSEIDGNGDGLVSMTELTAFMQKQGLADELRDSERTTAVEKAVVEKPPAAPPKPETVTITLPPSKPASVTIAVPPSPNEAAVPAVILQEMASADRDSNGFLTPDEVRGRFPYIEQNFSQVDSNGDGKISPAELAQLRKQQLLQKLRR